jgi:phospholipid transport system substrate-binding protein
VRRLQELTVAGLTVAGLVLVVTAAHADTPPASPLVQIHQTVDAVLAVLNDTALQPPGREEARRQAVLRVIEPRFDFEETARMALGRYWGSQTSDERRQFVALFSRLLERAYIGRILGYSGESVQYLGQTVGAERATVRTRIVTQRETEIPVDYRLLRQGNRWLVYDVRIEGMSLVENYREQFNDVIVSSSYGNLLKKMEARLHDETDTTETHAR